MPRADFYLVGKPRFREEPLRLVCELARKAHDAGQPTLVLARDREQAEALDDLLWAFDDDAYVAHQIAGDEEDDLAPVLIATPDMDVPLRPLLINLRDDAVDGGFER
ncbi:MAG TPA: DNA polymerase III subunit chi, partial [Candidatus Limnocylindrales bacterium]